MTLPRVLGIEAVGVVDDPSGTDLAAGQQVAAMMGGMGPRFDVGYAEYTVVPRDIVIPFRSELQLDVIGQVSETLQTAYGSLTVALDLRPGQTLLIRGGTPALGFAATAVAKDTGATVLGTSRQHVRPKLLARHGVDHSAQRRRRCLSSSRHASAPHGEVVLDGAAVVQLTADGRRRLLDHTDGSTLAVETAVCSLIADAIASRS